MGTTIAVPERMRGLGHTYVRGHVWWISYYAPDLDNPGKRKEYRETTHVPVTDSTVTPREVVALLQQRAAAAQTEKFTPRAEKLTFEDLVTAYMGTPRNEKATFFTANLRPWFARVKPFHWTMKFILGYHQFRLDAGAAVNTINRELSQLRAMYNLCADQGLPYRRFPHLAGGNVREGFTNPVDFYKLLSFCSDSDLRELLEFTYLSVWRCGKVKSLEWVRVELEPLAIIFPEQSQGNKKTGKPLPLTGPKGESTRLLEIIQSRFRKRHPDCPFVFHRDGRRISDFRHAWATLCKNAGCPNLRPHDLRRSGARNLARAGVSEQIIMDRAGWRTRSTFNRYNIADSADLAQSNTVYDSLIRPFIK